MTEEAWKDIPGYEGLYKISNHGRIESLSRRRSGNTHSSKSKFSFMTKGKILTNQVGGSGYWKTVLCKNGKQKNHNIHRLMAVAFIENPKNYPQVNHKDGDKLNCSIENLEWCTAKQNSRHAHEVIGVRASCTGVFGKDHPKSRPVIQMDLSGGIIKKWDSAMDAVRSGFTSSAISRCCNGSAKIHKGYRWAHER